MHHLMDVLLVFHFCFSKGPQSPGFWRTLNKQRVLIADSTTALAASFFPYLPFSLIHLFLKMDDAQMHFGAAHYRLCVLLWAFWSCNRL